MPDLLDFFITRKVSPNFIEVEENFDLDSDYSAVILTLSEKINKRATRCTVTLNKSWAENVSEFDIFTSIR